MNRIPLLRRFAAALLTMSAALASLGAAWPPEKFTNLKVLPQDIPQRELIGMMGDFTRALGVRCTHCHVGEEGKPLSTYDFASDEKETKAKAREMIRMVRDINERALASLPHRAEPSVRVECVTCHRGVEVPRQLEDVLVAAHAKGGLDSTLAEYRSLRERYYGRSAYDFGSVPLTVVAQRVGTPGRLADAVRLHALNVEMNPESEFAKRQHAGLAVQQAFQESGADEGRRVFSELRARYGADFVNEPLLIRLGYQLLNGKRGELAVSVFQLATETFPKSSNAFDSLGEAQASLGQKQAAIASYRKAVELDPANEGAKKKLAGLGVKKP